MHYAGARYYMSAIGRWNGPDPLADDFPAWSPYAYSYNNPLGFTDPTGMAPDPPAVGVGFSLRLQDSNAGWTFRANANISISSDLGAVQPALAVGGRVYNGGLGTTSGATGNRTLTADLTVTTAVSVQNGEGGALPVHSLSGSTPSGLLDDSKSSGTLASTSVFNSDGRNQRVGTIRLQGAGAALSVYNDKSFFGGILADGGDQYNTGGGSVTFNQGPGTVSGGMDVYTGSPPESGTTNGEYYVQPASQQNLNNGRTHIRTLNIGNTIGKQATGSRHMYPQNGIHRTEVFNTPLFRSTSINQ